MGQANYISISSIYKAIVGIIPDMAFVEGGRNINALVVGGAGIAGERHVAARGRLGGATTAIFDLNFDKAREVGERYGASVIETPHQMEEAAERANIVHVCTPDHQHTDLVIGALRSGAHVFVEKPMTTSLSEALRVQEASHANNREVAVGTGYRLTPTFSEVKRLIATGEVGEILSIETTYLHDMREPIKQTPWRINQDFLYGGGIHAIDLAYWILGVEIEEAQVSVGEKRIPNYKSFEDYSISLKTRSGVIARVWLNALAQLPTHGTDLKAYGTEGIYITHNRMDGYDHYEAEKKQSRFVKMQNNGVLTVDLQIAILDSWLRGNRPDYAPIPGVDEGVEVMRIVDAVERAISSSRTERV